MSKVERLASMFLEVLYELGVDPWRAEEICYGARLPEEFCRTVGRMARGDARLARSASR